MSAQIIIQFKLMSFGIEPKRLKSLIDLYHPHNHGEQLRYMIHLKGEEELFRNLETCPFQGITANSVEDRELAFGKNTLTPRKISVFAILVKALSVDFIYIPIILSICLILYNGIGDAGPIIQGILLLISTVINWLLRATEDLYNCFRWSKTDNNIDEVSCIVVRENKRSKVFSSELTVGDVIEFKQGDTVPADGWLVEGYDIAVIEKYLSEFVESEKETLRKCVTDIKVALQKNPALNEKNISLDEVKSPKSPVLLGGSTVKSGEGRMVVLCVGKYSQQGQFLALSHQRLEPNLLKSKMDELRSSLFNHLLFFTALYILLYVIINVETAAIHGTMNHLLYGKEWHNLQISLVALVFGSPIGLHIGFLFGLFNIKMRMWFTDGIWVDYVEDLPRMAAVTDICYDREKDWGKVQYREWWNEEKFTFRREEQDYEEKDEVEMTQQAYMEDVEVDLSQNFKEMMRKGLRLKGSEQPGHQYLVSPEATLKKNSINDWNVFQQANEEGDIHYLCMGNTVKYLTTGDESTGVVMVKGQGRTILDLCNSILSKSSGEIQQLNTQLKTEVHDVIQSMERRLVATHAVAYVKNDHPTLQAQIKKVAQGGLTLVCVLGVSSSRDHSDYEIVRRLRQAGVSLVLVSSKPHTEAVSRSKFIGINTIQHDSLLLDSKDFSKVVGGVICFTCKKTYCICQNEFDHDPRLKNLEEFRRITKYLKVMSSANFYEKYSLMVGYKNVGRLSAFMGTEQEDRPAQTAAYLSISAQGGISGSQMRFPSNSLRTLQSCIIWSRLTAYFARKLLQLVLPACIVPATILLLSGLLFKTVSLTPLQLLWVCLPICAISALNLSWERPQENLNEPAVSFGAESLLLPQTVRKQVISQCLIQTLLLFILLVAGHLFLPESADAMDVTIGSNWQAKYQNINKDKVASGLTQNFLIKVPSYTISFDTYGIYSRHLSIVFNTYALMQIFNYLNCRKVGKSQINVLQGLQWHNVLLFITTLAIQCIFVEIAPPQAHLYPYGLTLQQWMLSLAMAIVVWITGFLVRLLPDSSSEKTNKRRWGNKSYNLGIKLVGKSDKFYQFDRDEDAIFKFH